MASTATPYPSDSARLLIEDLPAILRLAPKARSFVLNFVADPTSLPKACVSASCSRQSYKYLLQNPLVVQAIREEVGRRKAESTTLADVISKAMQLVDKIGTKEDPASDMAKARALELIADLKGWRDRKPASADPATQPAISATFINSPPALASASSTIAALQSYQPDPDQD
jgi:hypothetical protein